MSAPVRNTPCPHCSRRVADAHALNQHIRSRHPSVKGVRRSKRQSPNAIAPMNATDAYAFVESLDQPDGAHWAMLEELTGLEPADFAFMGDDL